ncbi:sensor histidine kinase [Nitrincola alkalisediminis]|uniref:sensor histidine kinase n=1 Tax=Nitrincola alkalisediminis TaxID=1366656 RepID=UPI001874742C|nr:ATP-binding protein [Nitrincola alkalisediminis]
MVARLRKRLKQEMALAFLSVSLIALTIVGSVAAYHIFYSQRQLVLVTQQQVAQRVSQEVKELLKRSVRHLELLVISSDFERQPLSVQSELLFEFFHWKKTHDFIALYAADKTYLFHTHRLYSQSQGLSDSGLIHAALGDVVRTQKSYFGDIVYNSTTGEPSILIAIPVKDVVTGNMTHIIVVSLRFKAIWDIMAREARESQFSVFLVSDDHRVVAHKDPSVVLAQQRFHLDEGVYVSRGVDGHRAIIGKALLSLENRHYVLYSEQSFRHAFSEAREKAIWMLVGVLLAFCVAVVLGIQFSRRITQPLDQLLTGVRSVTKGDLDQQIEVSGRNELSMLAQYFNEMTRQLRDLIFELRSKTKDLEAEVCTRVQAEDSLRTLNSELEQRVIERTQVLQETLDHLQSTQESLVQSEKLAGLGAMVAGVAHELNTPIGNALMMSSTLKEKSQEFEQSLQQGLRKSELQSYTDLVKKGSEILCLNLNQSARLISSFKQVAVDQTSYQRRSFLLSEVVEEIVLTMAPTLRHSSVKVSTSIPDSIRLDSYPGPLGQILLNLINNAILHAFSEGESGAILIQAKQEGERLLLTLEDNGKGISPDHLGRIFDPFFTTRLGQGGSGLGLSIVFNLVKGILGGSIEVSSELGKGTQFCLDIPLVR